MSTQISEVEVDGSLHPFLYHRQMEKNGKTSHDLPILPSVSLGEGVPTPPPGCQVFLQVLAYYNLRPVLQRLGQVHRPDLLAASRSTPSEAKGRQVRDGPRQLEDAVICLLDNKEARSLGLNIVVIAGCIIWRGFTAAF